MTVSVNVTLRSCDPTDRSVSFVPVRASNCSNPAVARRPLVVPEVAKIVSQALIAVSRSGRPAPGPEVATPWRCARSATSGSGWNGTPLVTMPRLSVSGPRVSNFAPIWV